MTTLLAAFPEDRVVAGRLAQSLGVALRMIEVHRFADGESLPIVPIGSSGIVVYRSLHQPDPKLFSLLLAADAWRRAGVDRLTLAAPYLCYMRQDAVFHAGEPLSRDVLGRILGPVFDRIVTIDPHLHRTGNLASVFETEVAVGGAGPLLAEAIGAPGADWVVVGPDEESLPWAASIASALQAPSLTLTKRRSGDRSVNLTEHGLGPVNGRRAVLVDDICSSGSTMEAAIPMLLEAGAVSVDIAVTHALFGAGEEARLRAAGAGRILFTDSCRNGAGAVPLAPLLAEMLGKEFS